MATRKGISEREKQFNAQIGMRIEQIRRERKIPSAELAKAAGVTQQMFFQYEAGLVRWPVLRVRLIADYLREPIELILPKSKEYVVIPAAPQKLF